MIAVLSDTATAIIVVGCVVIVALILNRSLSGKFGKIEVQLGSIDKSVNHRADHEPTMSQDVAVIRKQVEDLTGIVTALAERVGLLEQPKD